jgi:Big-like domain-containing protein/PKD domain-containing protein
MMMLRRISFLCAALVATVAAACDTVPLTAPSGSALTITAGSTFVPTGGTTEVTAFVAEQSGTAVQNGTTVHFATNLGRMDPVDAQTKNGYATATFHAGDSSGVADITATSGGVGGGTPSTGNGDGNGTTTTTTSSNTVRITVGAAAVETVLLAANPGSVPSEGGTVDLLATVTAANGRSLQGLLVTFASSEGTLSSSTATTDSNGQARVTLTTNRNATVTASAGAKQSTAVTVTRRDPASVATATLTATAGTPVVGSGQSFSFTATVNVSPADPAIQATRFEWAFGDGSSITTNSPSTSHVYTTGPNSVRIVTVKIDLTNGQTLVATTQILLGTF